MAEFEELAFPRPNDFGNGLTKREWYASMAMIGILLRGGKPDAKATAIAAFFQADAMIAKGEEDA